ncbi:MULTISPECIES: LysR family transcriptional regulator [Piscirickettsiaceae]|uniref:LysR family transcriptional regulator n=1 Tax=Hydrogenovibrio thermophilus TaxID=265883 RepID=A0A410H427_9GAMM|nr:MULTISPECIES: LysR family transcriptional regulator [Piscirickettsiaceae]AZR81792.1 LysR family transcriptional regulator [Thiomicrospira sp. S5]QAB15682.1 LysR family transcriptional regulator [Hydrogenovibrio thermophilus]
MADRRLQVFYTVAKVLSFTKAAETLHMTQPAVTFQVKQLEEFFNTRLFDRTHNKITLTEAGKIVYDYAEKILDHYEKMNSEVRELTGEVTGSLLIGASTTIAEYMLPSLLGAFKKQFEDVNIRLQVGNTDAIVAMVENNMIDLGVVEAPVYNKNLEVEVCRLDEMVLIVPEGHPLSNRDKISVEDMRKYRYISREEGSGSRSVIDNYIREQGLSYSDLNVVMELGSPEAVKMAVESDVGIAIVSRTTIVKEMKLGTLKALPLDPPLTRPFSHVRQKHKFRHRAVGELLDFAVDYCKEKAVEQGFQLPTEEDMKKYTSRGQS